MSLMLVGSGPGCYPQFGPGPPGNPGPPGPPGPPGIP